MQKRFAKGRFRRGLAAALLGGFLSVAVARPVNSAEEARGGRGRAVIRHGAGQGYNVSPEGGPYASRTYSDDALLMPRRQLILAGAAPFDVVARDPRGKVVWDTRLQDGIPPCIIGGGDYAVVQYHIGIIGVGWEHL